MKKILGIIVLGLLLSGNAYAKIDKSYVNQIYDGCISDAKQNNDYNSDSKKFCKCYANEFNKKFNNAGLMEFMNKSDQAKAKIIQNEISPPCYPVTKKTNNNKTNITCINNKDGSSWSFIIDDKNKIIYEDDWNTSTNGNYKELEWNDKKIYIMYNTGGEEHLIHEMLKVDRTSGVLQQWLDFPDGKKIHRVFNCKLTEAAKF